MRDRKAEFEQGRLSTTDNRPAEKIDFDASAPAPVKDNGQHESYWILSPEERAKGFVRPVRQTYLHTKCGGQTSMGREIAETYAREPAFYGATFCVNCGQHLPVGAAGDFVWVDNGRATTEKVGT